MVWIGFHVNTYKTPKTGADAASFNIAYVVLLYRGGHECLKTFLMNDPECMKFVSGDDNALPADDL